MSIDNMIVYDEEIMTTTIELLGQKLEAFNAASLNALVLSATTFMGNFTKESFYDTLAGAQRRVNRNGANGAVGSTGLTQSEMVGVKIAGGFGPVLFEPSQLTYLQKNPEEAIMVISEGFANALLADQLNTALLCAVAAIGNQPTATLDETLNGGVTQVRLNQSYALFSDRSSSLVTTFCHGEVYHKLVTEALNNSNELFNSGTIRVVDIQGKRLVYTDAPALKTSTTSYQCVTLVTNGGIVDNTSDIVSNLDTRNGNERIETTWQADYTFGLKLKGYAWNTAITTPNDAELGTGANWNFVMADIKHQAGVLLITDQS